MRANIGPSSRRSLLNEIYIHSENETGSASDNPRSQAETMASSDTISGYVPG